jgi:hypothetical protein
MENLTPDFVVESVVQNMQTNRSSGRKAWDFIEDLFFLKVSGKG